ncbi:MAG: rhomboid family intramembrane serine protease [Thermacetogeniaceae bacterium]|jgi:membrane associated rhomboid family serine protease
MIPLRDSTRSRTFPIVNVSLIVINFIVFFKEISLSNQALNQLTFTYGLVPAHVASQLAAGAPFLSLATPFITAMFLHANWLHIIGNMLYLWIFGDNVEDRVGHIPYLFFYLLVGVAGSIVYCLASPASRVPIIGASGAIAGILGAYFVLYPKAKVLTLLPLFFFITLVEIPAVWFLLLWFGMQVLNGFTTSLAADSVAWWAHIGGFVAGAALINLFAASERFKV